MQILIALFYIWLILALFATALIGVLKARYNAELRRRARQQAWDEKMLTTEWGQEIMAARENFRSNSLAWAFDDMQRTRRLWRRRERQPRDRGPIVIFRRATWSWLVPSWRQTTAQPSTHSAGQN